MPNITAEALKAGISILKHNHCAKCRKYYQNNRDRLLANAKKDYWLNPDASKEKSRRYYQNNSDAIIESALKRQKDNPKRSRAYNRKSYRKNPEKFRVRASLNFAYLRLAVLNFLGGKCYVKNCQANEYPEQLRFIGLEPHHLNKFDRVKDGYRRIWKERQDVLSGKEKEVQLLCGFHHAIADKLGKKKWLELLVVLNTGAKLKEIKLEEKINE